jgi:exodeoxyribonuclease VII large subunit
MTLFDAPAEPKEPQRVSLVRLAAHIAKAVSDVGRFSVEGEVHRPSSGNGRQWFTLRDRASQISVSIPASRRNRCRAVAGERVLVTGRLEWVPQWGQLQLAAEEVVPVGAGAIAAMIAEAQTRLAADGLIDRPRRRIPRLPATIGVICGRDAAVRADIQSVVAARFPGYPVLFLETTVSGPGAPDHIMAALADLDARPEVDVIVLARGGGDATQLLAFSDEDLCRAVCASSTPVVSAIGHDGDRPLVDMVADLRCGTPSLAAGAVVPDRAALQEELAGWLAAAGRCAAGELEDSARRLAAVDRDGAARQALAQGHLRVTAAAGHLRLLRPSRLADEAGARLARVAWHEPASTRLATAERALKAGRDQADALSPARVLARGYAVVRRAGDQVVVRAPADAPAGTDLILDVSGGTLAARSQ